MKTEVLKNFIVLEGLDGSGTTTQLNNLYKALQKDNIAIEKTFEPTDDEIGKLIRRILRKEFSQDAKTISKLFIADRNEHIYGEKGIKELTKTDCFRFTVKVKHQYWKLCFFSNMVKACFPKWCITASTFWCNY